MKPKHMAFIMDGNRRHGRKIGISLKETYELGLRKLLETIRLQVKFGIIETSYFALSVDNYEKRSIEELKILFEVLQSMYEDKEFESFVLENKIQVNLIGNLEILDKSTNKFSGKEIAIRKMREKFEEVNAKIETPNFKVNIMALYDGHREIVHSFQKIIEKVESGELKKEEISEETIKENMWTSKSITPDIIIRFGDAPRLSGFLTWDSKYSEIYLSKKYWSVFDEEEFENILKWFEDIQRNYGV